MLYPKKANLLKSSGAKLKGLRLLNHGRQLPKEGVILFGLKYFFAEDFFNLSQNSFHKSTHPLLKYPVKKDFVQLLKLLKNYHFETYRHSVTVARLSFLISQELGISTDEIIANTIGGLLHDIGKIKINHSRMDFNKETP